MYFPLEYRNFETASELYVAAGGSASIASPIIDNSLP